MQDSTAALHALIARYPGNVPSQSAPQEWTAEPCDGWGGPTDDADLITRAMRSQSASSRLTGRAAFKDLWEANEDALAATYPSDTDAYDASRADAALAAHLMFWTGKDCERVERLMRQSALARPKWDERGDYLRQRTIMHALRNCREVCNKVHTGKPVGSTDTRGNGRERAGTGGNGQTAPAGIVPPDAQRELWRGATYVLDADRILIGGGMMIDATQFSRWFPGRYVLDAANQRIAKTAAEAFFNSEVNVCPRVVTSAFLPQLVPGAVTELGGRSTINTYYHIRTPRKTGDATPFLDHLRLMLPAPRDREILLAYMAAVVQHKGIKFQWAPVLVGAPGNGKTLMAHLVEYAVSPTFTHSPPVSELAEKFNSWMLGAILVYVDDVHVTVRNTELIEILKPMITAHTVSVRGMGRERVMRPVCCNFMFSSNIQGGMPKHRDDRRLAVFHTAQQSREDSLRDGITDEYRRNLRRWLVEQDGFALVSELLHTHAIPDELNPAYGHTAPETSTTREAIAASRGTVEQEIQEAIDAGRQGFRGGWVSSTAVTAMLRESHLRLPPRVMRGTMQALGYDWHPGLPDGRTNATVPPDGTKPKLFIRAGHPDATLEGVAVERAYSAAQTELTSGLRAVR